MSKFRVWNKKEKKYSSKKFIIDDNGLLFYVERGDITPAYEEEYIVEKCLGIKDRNNKYIYEHDIMENGEITIFIVYEDNLLKYRAYDQNGNVSDMYVYSKGFSVIGNMNENPDKYPRKINY